MRHEYVDYQVNSEGQQCDNDDLLLRCQGSRWHSCHYRSHNKKGLLGWTWVYLIIIPVKQSIVNINCIIRNKINYILVHILYCLVKLSYVWFSYGEFRMRVSDNFSNISCLTQRDILLSLPEHAEVAANIDLEDIPASKKICLFGVGESSIAGDIISAYADDYSKIPVPNITSEIVPNWVDKDTDTILVSHSGNNIIINSVYDFLKERGCRIYCIVNKGRLMEKCRQDNNKLFAIPEGLTARSALGFELGILSVLVERMGICDTKSKLIETIPLIKEYRDSLFTDERIYNLKFKLHDKTIAVYGSPDFRASFKRWKMSLNYDMGSPSFYGELPEFNHNEIVGWANHNQDDEDLRIVMLRGKYKSIVLTKIIDTTMEVLEESGRHVIDVKILGSNPIEKNMRAILLADYLSQMIEMESRNPMSWGESL